MIELISFLNSPLSHLKPVTHKVNCYLEYAISIGNHMDFSAIWDKSAQVNFSRANQICCLSFDYVFLLAVFMVHWCGLLPLCCF